MGQGDSQLTIEKMRDCFNKAITPAYNYSEDAYCCVMNNKNYGKLEDYYMATWSQENKLKAEFEVQKAKNGYVLKYNGELYIARTRRNMLQLIAKLTAGLK